MHAKSLRGGLTKPGRERKTHIKQGARHRRPARTEPSDAESRPVPSSVLAKPQICRLCLSLPESRTNEFWAGGWLSLVGWPHMISSLEALSRVGVIKINSPSRVQVSKLTLIRLRD